MISNKFIYWWEKRCIGNTEKGNPRAFNEFEYDCYSYNVMHNRYCTWIYNRKNNVELFETDSIWEKNRIYVLKLRIINSDKLMFI